MNNTAKQILSCQCRSDMSTAQHMGAKNGFFCYQSQLEQCCGQFFFHKI